MRYGVKPENLKERIALAAGLVPTPLADTLVAMWLARTLMAASKLGIFEALADGPLAASDVAARAGTDPRATEKLLDALVGARYVRARGGRYALTAVARTWLLPDSPRSLHDSMLLHFLEWDFVEHYERFVRTGQPLRFHETMSPNQWALYQRGMRSLANLAAAEVARRLPVPKGARTMLDVGGGHGYFSVEICRRHPRMHAVILDLPEAVEHAAEILEREGLGDRVVHRAGDALTDDLGTELYDLVLLANLVHHFAEDVSRDLVRRAARALRPGGCLAIHEVVRPASPRDADQVGALAGLYFAATSQAGTWSFEEMADWQRTAGLVPRKPQRLLSVPGYGQLVAIKPRSA